MNSNPPPTLEKLARRSLEGDRDAVQRLVRALQRDVYRLALRMLWNRQDAEDATQEILVRVITRLSTFDFDSRLATWVYRVAANYLLDVKKSAVERQRLTFEQFADDLADGQSTDGPTDAERSVLTEEVKIGCTLGMLQCHDRPHRLAYILGEIFELPSADATKVLGVEPAAFRKRLERARERIESFAQEHCGLVSDRAGCQCNRRVPVALRLGRANADALQFATAPESFEQARLLVRRVGDARRALEIHRSTNPADSPVDFAGRVVSALEPETD